MRTIGWLAQTIAPVAVSGAIALTLATIGAAPVSADCDGPVPSFREFAATASLIVIGDVVATDPTAPWTDREGRSSRFRLRVRHVVRGDAERTVSLRDLAYLPCADHVIRVRRGDRIALALGATGFGVTFDTVAWIRGTPPETLPPGIERITVSEVYALVGADAPDTSSPAPTSQSWAALRSCVLAVAGLGGAIAALRWRPARRRTAGGPALRPR